MALTLSDLRLRAIVVLIVSKHNGITLVFKNDPVESLNVSSTFDSISVLKGFIQKEIEGQLREMFREDLPGIIHTLSQRWFSSEASVEVERPIPATPVDGIHPGASSSASYVSPLSPPSLDHPTSVTGLDYEPSLTSRTTPRAVRHPPPSSCSLSSSPPRSSFPDLEEFDPTYGLRSDALPTSTVVSGAKLGRIWERNRGFGEIFEDDFPDPGDGDEMSLAPGGSRGVEEVEEDAGESVFDEGRDYFSLGGGRRNFSSASDFGGFGLGGGSSGQRSRGGSFAGAGGVAVSVASTPRTIHAVGGGTVVMPFSMPTTPRTTQQHHVHSSSIHRGRSPAPSLGGPPPMTSRRPPSRAHSYDFGTSIGSPPPNRYRTPPLSHSISTTPSRSSASIATPSSSFGPLPAGGVGASSSSSYLSTSPHNQRNLSTSQGLPETISHLTQLSLSNHTLSQYTREHAHVAMRSHPPSAFALASGGGGGGSVPGTPGAGAGRKALRKRMHRLNSTAA